MFRSAGTNAPPSELGCILAEVRLRTDLKEVESRLKDCVKIARKNRLEVLVEILNEALSECRMQITLVSKGRRPL